LKTSNYKICRIYILRILSLLSSITSEQWVPMCIVSKIKQYAERTKVATVLPRLNSLELNRLEKAKQSDSTLSLSGKTAAACSNHLNWILTLSLKE